MNLIGSLCVSFYLYHSYSRFKLIPNSETPQWLFKDWRSGNSGKQILFIQILALFSAFLLETKIIELSMDKKCVMAQFAPQGRDLSLLNFCRSFRFTSTVLNFCTSENEGEKTRSAHWGWRLFTFRIARDHPQKAFNNLLLSLAIASTYTPNESFYSCCRRFEPRTLRYWSLQPRAHSRSLHNQGRSHKAVLLRSWSNFCELLINFIRLAA